jgi:hypothetical protein
VAIGAAGAMLTVAVPTMSYAGGAHPAARAFLVTARHLPADTPVQSGSCQAQSPQAASCDSIRGRRITAAGLRALVNRDRAADHARVAATGRREDVAVASVAHLGTAPDNGYGPTDLESMYGVTPALAPTTTVGIVDWHQDPTVAADLATFRTKFGLPSCTTASGCFTELAANGGHVAVANKGEIGEISLDVDAVSSICPTCHITLVDAASGQASQLFPAVKSLTAAGVRFVSMSWSVPESATAEESDSYFAAPDTTYVAASGDNGYDDGSGKCGGAPVCYPASAPGVIAAGGVSTTQDATHYYFGAWKGAGSGCARYATEAPAQAAAIGNPCSGEKAVADVSALADPNTGAAIFSSANGWGVYGGTSLATPLITALYALAGNSSNPATFYANNAAHTGQVLDVTTGASAGCNGATVCTASIGWDGPTGIGVPTTPQVFTNDPAVSITLTAAHGTTATIQLGQTLTGSPFVAVGGSGNYQWSATGLPAGLTIDATSGAWAGTPTSGGVYPIVVAVADAKNTKSVSSAVFTLTVHSPLSLSTESGKPAALFALPSLPVDAAPVSAHGATSALTWAATALPAGLTIDPATGVLTGKPTRTGVSSTVVTATTAAGDTATLDVTFVVAQFYRCSNYLVSRVGRSVDDDCGAYWSLTPKQNVGFHHLPGTLSYQSRDLPAGLRINPHTGVISGKPRSRANGAFHVTIHIHPDGLLVSKATQFTYEVSYTVRS